MNEYFYIDNLNQQHGPVSEDKLLAEGVQRHTLVWCKGMTDWQPADTVAELRKLFEDAEQQARQTQSQPGQQQEQSYRQNPNEPPPYANYQQGQSFQNNYNRPPFPNNYLVWAVLVTICCCLPLGIVAIVKSNQVSGLYYRGLYDEAYLAAEDAKKWTIAALIVGLISCGGGACLNFLTGFGELLPAFLYL